MSSPWLSWWQRARGDGVALLQGGVELGCTAATAGAGQPVLQGGVGFGWSSALDELGCSLVLPTPSIFGVSTTLSNGAFRVFLNPPSREDSARVFLGI